MGWPCAQTQKIHTLRTLKRVLQSVAPFTKFLYVLCEETNDERPSS
jgi:hypothetical protein